MSQLCEPDERRSGGRGAGAAQHRVRVLDGSLVRCREWQEGSRCGAEQAVCRAAVKCDGMAGARIARLPPPGRARRRRQPRRRRRRRRVRRLPSPPPARACSSGHVTAHRLAQAQACSRARGIPQHPRNVTAPTTCAAPAPPAPPAPADGHARDQRRQQPRARVPRQRVRRAAGERPAGWEGRGAGGGGEAIWRKGAGGPLRASAKALAVADVRRLQLPGLWSRAARLDTAPAEA
jgi:hypothetical protein